RVTDEKGQPLPGATISVKNTRTAVAANIDGYFTITNVSPPATLVFSFTGLITQEVNVDNRTTINITLLEDKKNLNEVVVVGYGTQKKVNLTGAVAMVTAEAFESRPITSVSTGLQGLLPGLAAVSFTGQPGASNATLRIRGVGTTNNSAPFVVVDGIPGDLNYLNPDDIETVSVLKDAASAAIYGSRAANGVILVTTKRGKLNQKPIVNYDGYVGTQMPTALPKMLGSVEYMQYLNESQTNVGLAPTFTAAQIEIARNGTDPNFYANTNWPKALFKSSAPQQNHNVSINGGSSDLSYYMSYARQDQKGLVVGNQYDADRNNVRLRLNSNNILNVIDLDGNIGFIDRLQNQPADETVIAGGPIYQTLTASPLTPVYFTNGTYGYGGGSANPVATATVGGFNKLTSQDFTGNIAGTAHILKNLSARVVYGLNTSNQNAVSFARKVDYFDPNTNAFLFTNRASNFLQNTNYRSRLENISAQINYDLNVGQNHFKTLLGYQQEQFKYETFSASKTNFVSNDVPILDLGSANPLAYGNAYQYALRSYFGRINYDYQEKYLLEFNLRYDGSSRYAPDKRYGAFPSASAGWRFTQENFIKDAQFLDWLSEGKIRASYGTLGNQYGADGPGYSEWYPYIGVIGAAGTASTNMPIG
ncbi:MAG: SusC/RagA family TonB-linked outer membrane protein, partial [Sphingobacteriaceae bacterium]